MPPDLPATSVEGCAGDDGHSPLVEVGLPLPGGQGQVHLRDNTSKGVWCLVSGGVSWCLESGVQGLVQQGWDIMSHEMVWNRARLTSDWPNGGFDRLVSNEVSLSRCLATNYPD